MKQKDLKIDFRYLTGNIACLSVDSISGESVHNDINNEEAIIIFNSLVGEKADCQTVKSLLEENQELKSQLNGTTYCFDEEEHERLKSEKEQLNSLVNSCQEKIRQLKKQLENKYEKVGTLTSELLYEENTKLINQQKEFIKYLEDKIKKLENNHEHMVVDMFGSYDLNELDLDILKEVLQKYEETIGGNKDDN